MAKRVTITVYCEDVDVEQVEQSAHEFFVSHECALFSPGPGKMVVVDEGPTDENAAAEASFRCQDDDDWLTQEED